MHPATATSFLAQLPANADPSQRFTLALLVMAGMLIVAPAMCICLWILWRRRHVGERAGTGEAVCAACRYPVRGLSTFQCPECGADLRDVGMLKLRGAGGFRRTAVAWTIMWVLLMIATVPTLEGVVGSFNVEQYAPHIIIWGILAWFTGLVYMLRQPAGQSPSASSVAIPRADHRTSLQPRQGAAITRNLSVMFIDVEDFTGLAAKETRDGLLVVIRKARDMVKPVIARHHGKLVKTMGDGFLATFESPTDAVLCGRGVQAEAASRAATEGDKALRLRIGVTTGEVALEDDDVFGDPVNLAARLQQLAPPGEVFFSEATFHAMTRSEVPHEPAGQFEIKGVERPVLVYRAVGE